VLLLEETGAVEGRCDCGCEEDDKAREAEEEEEPVLLSSLLLPCGAGVSEEGRVQGWCDRASSISPSSSSTN
jgi:hypothetical protein